MEHLAAEVEEGCQRSKNRL